jgi:hypothetical protein
VAVDANAVETLVDRGGQFGLGRFGVQRPVGQDQAQHGGHVRADHRRPLGHAGDLHLPAVERHRSSGQLVDGVGRHHALGGGKEGLVVGVELLGGCLDPSGNSVHRQELADDSGGEDQGLRFVGFAGRGGEPGHLAGVGQALLARAGVRVTRVDYHRTHPLTGRPLTIQHDRSGTDHVLRVHAGGHRGGVADHEDEILLLGIRLDPAVNACQPKTLGNADGHQRIVSRVDFD